MAKQRSLLNDEVDWLEGQNPDGPKPLRELRHPVPVAGLLVPKRPIPSLMFFRLWSGSAGKVIQDDKGLPSVGLEAEIQSHTRLGAHESVYDGYRWRFATYSRLDVAPPLVVCRLVFGQIPGLVQNIPVGRRDVSIFKEVLPPYPDLSGSLKGFHSWDPVTIELYWVKG